MESEPDDERELSDLEAAAAMRIRRELAMTPEERLRAMDRLCREITLLATTARRMT